MSKFVVVLLFAMIALGSALNIPKLCKPEERKAEFCTKIYAPVCGINPYIRCIRAPCPNTQTFSNACEACKSPMVTSYTAGACDNSDIRLF